MRNLVIGNTSQLARYFPDDYVKISSRNIPIDELKNKKWDCIYICYAEQRTFLAHSEDPNVSNLFYDTNYKSVLKLINDLKDNCKKIIYYSTAELWNNLNGPISIDTPFSYISNHYTQSKYDISYELKNKKKYYNVCIAYPFNFNSVYRSDGYLFSKIFKSILTKQAIVIGDIDYYRELLHPSMVVEESIKNKNICNDFIIGSGRVSHVEDFIKKLYLNFDMNYEDYVTIKKEKSSIYRSKIFYNSKFNPNCNEDRTLYILTNELKTLMKGSV